jgi:hypothetical protein
MIVEMTTEQELSMARGELGGIVLQLLRAYPTVRIPLSTAVGELVSEVLTLRAQQPETPGEGAGAEAMATIRERRDPDDTR